MLQAPTNDRKTNAETRSKTAKQLPKQARSSQVIGGMNRSIQQRGDLAALQKTYGNQAVLRMKGQSSVTNPTQRSVLHRKCASENLNEANQTISLAQLSHPRCEDEDDSCLDDEPANYRGLLGVAICNFNTGKVDQLVDKEHCVGNCVRQHEETHVADMSPCCQKASQCVEKAQGVEGRNRCREEYSDYSKRTSDWTECNAYNIEGQCLTALINQQCRMSGGLVSNECCASLEEHLVFVTKKITQHCAEALFPTPCPFTEAGGIVPGL